MELCPGGDLASKLAALRQRSQRLPEASVWRYLLQVVSALRFVHSRKILHRDLKAQNVFVGTDGNGMPAPKRHKGDAVGTDERAIARRQAQRQDGSASGPHAPRACKREELPHGRRGRRVAVVARREQEAQHDFVARPAPRVVTATVNSSVCPAAARAGGGAAHARVKRM